MNNEDSTIPLSQKDVCDIMKITARRFRKYLKQDKLPIIRQIGKNVYLFNQIKFEAFVTKSICKDSTRRHIFLNEATKGG